MNCRPARDLAPRVPGFAPDLDHDENRITFAFLVRL
jgi:hypothetical protein